jgi:hypothetical protein
MAPVPKRDSAELQIVLQAERPFQVRKDRWMKCSELAVDDAAFKQIDLCEGPKLQRWLIELIVMVKCAVSNSNLNGGHAHQMMTGDLIQRPDV